MLNNEVDSILFQIHSKIQEIKKILIFEDFTHEKIRKIEIKD